MALGEESPAAVKTRHLWVSATFATGLLETRDVTDGDSREAEVDFEFWISTSQADWT